MLGDANRPVSGSHMLPPTVPPLAPSVPPTSCEGWPRFLCELFEVFGPHASSSDWAFAIFCVVVVLLAIISLAQTRIEGMYPLWLPTRSAVWYWQVQFWPAQLLRPELAADVTAHLGHPSPERRLRALQVLLKLPEEATVARMDSVAEQLGFVQRNGREIDCPAGWFCIGLSPCSNRWWLYGPRIRLLALRLLGRVPAAALEPPHVLAIARCLSDEKSCVCREALAVLNRLPQESLAPSSTILASIIKKGVKINPWCFDEQCDCDAAKCNQSIFATVHSHLGFFRASPMWADLVQKATIVATHTQATSSSNLLILVDECEKAESTWLESGNGTRRRTHTRGSLVQFDVELANVGMQMRESWLTTVVRTATENNNWALVRSLHDGLPESHPEKLTIIHMVNDHAEKERQLMFHAAGMPVFVLSTRYALPTHLDSRAFKLNPLEVSDVVKTAIETHQSIKVFNPNRDNVALLAGDQRQANAVWLRTWREMLVRAKETGGCVLRLDLEEAGGLSDMQVAETDMASDKQVPVVVISHNGASTSDTIKADLIDAAGCLSPRFAGLVRSTA